MKTQTLESQILSFLQATPILDLAPLDPHVCDAREIESLFQAGTDFLRKLFPNPVINRLMRATWDTVGNKIVPVCFGFKVPTLAFILESDSAQPFIATPKKWASMVHRDPITQMGALVFVGSQAVDYAHERIPTHQGEKEKMALRARAYESEYLSTVRGLTPSWEPNRYQEELLREFPEGVATPKARNLLYSILPLVLA
jgi:hypothetical protein